MKAPNKTPQQMVEFWEAELAKIDEEELKGITMWSRSFITAKIDLWKEVIEGVELQELRCGTAKQR